LDLGEIVIEVDPELDCLARNHGFQFEAKPPSIARMR
jgi:hypothetical protein